MVSGAQPPNPHWTSLRNCSEPPTRSAKPRIAGRQPKPIPDGSCFGDFPFSSSTRNKNPSLQSGRSPMEADDRSIGPGGSNRTTGSELRRIRTREKWGAGMGQQFLVTREKAQSQSPHPNVAKGATLGWATRRLSPPTHRSWNAPIILGAGGAKWSG
jgi:hypothetical protein